MRRSQCASIFYAMDRDNAGCLSYKFVSREGGIANLQTPTTQTFAGSFWSGWPPWTRSRPIRLSGCTLSTACMQVRPVWWLGLF